MRTPYITATKKKCAMEGMTIDLLALFLAISFQMVGALKQSDASPEVAREMLVGIIDEAIAKNGGGKRNDEGEMDSRSEAG